MERAVVAAFLAAAVAAGALTIRPGPLRAATSTPGALPEAYVTPAPDTRIIPQPKSLRWIGRGFEIGPATRIIVGDGAGPEDLYAAREINEELAAWGAPPLPVVRVSEAAGPAGAIVLGEPWLNPLASAALAAEGLRATPEDPGPEGYVLEIREGMVIASGSDRRGTFYAAQTLRQLIGRDPDNPSRIRVKGARIRDWPDHRIRALHVVLDGHSDLFHTALVERILSRYKFNTLIAESEYVRWESAPAIWHSGGATKAQAAAVVASARAHLIEPVPLIQTLGHSGWLFHNDQNLDLLEMPAELAPARFAYDPLNPRVYEVVLPILDEAISLFGAGRLHIGHDEVRNVVPFPWSPEGRRLGFAELFLQDVLRLHGHLRSRGVETMMWGDVLLNTEYAAEWARLPRDIVVVDWQYHAAVRYPSIERLRSLGFPVLAASWHRPGNIASLSADARRAGASGMVQTTWTGYFGNRAALQSLYHQIYAYTAAADHFWSSARADPSLSQVEAAARFRADWAIARPRQERIPGRALDLRAATNLGHVDRPADLAGAGWLRKGPGYDLGSLPTGTVRLGGVQYEILDPRERPGRSVVALRGQRDPLRGLPERASVGAGLRAGELCFLHTLPYPALRFAERVATYTVLFGDGGKAEIPVRHGVEIGTWLDDPRSIAHEIAWAGRTGSGVEARLSAMCWPNPDPGRPIVAVELAASEAAAAPVVFAITALEKRRAQGGRDREVGD